MESANKPSTKKLGRPSVHLEPALGVRISASVYERLALSATVARRTMRQQADYLISLQLDQLDGATLETRGGGR